MIRMHDTSPQKRVALDKGLRVARDPLNLMLLHAWKDSQVVRDLRMHRANSSSYIRTCGMARTRGDIALFAHQSLSRGLYRVIVQSIGQHLESDFPDNVHPVSEDQIVDAVQASGDGVFNGEHRAVHHVFIQGLHG